MLTRLRAGVVGAVVGQMTVWAYSVVAFAVVAGGVAAAAAAAAAAAVVGVDWKTA